MTLCCFFFSKQKVIYKTIFNVFFFFLTKTMKTKCILKIVWIVENIDGKKVLFVLKKKSNIKSKRWNLCFFTLEDILKTYLELRDETYWKIMVYIRGSFYTIYRSLTPLSFPKCSLLVARVGIDTNRTLFCEWKLFADSAIPAHLGKTNVDILLY